MPSPAPPQRPLEALWQPSALVALMLAGEGLALLLALSPGSTGDRWVHFGLASLMIQWVALLTVGVLYLGRERFGQMPLRRVAWLALVLLVASSWLAGGIAWWLLDAWQVEGGWPEFMLRLGLTAVTVGLFGVVAFENHWRARQLAVQAKQAQLEALQARIRPHFLFNTLNTGASLVHARPGEAEQLLLDLADLFRAALSGPREIPLADELALARRYLEIESLRFGSRLRLNWALPEQLPDVLVPTLSIQPLVENAIRHGVEPSDKGCAVDVSVELDPGSVRIVIRNDLPQGGSRPTDGHRVGLVSSRERILALSQGRGRLDTEVIDGRYTSTITLPRD